MRFVSALLITFLSLSTTHASAASFDCRQAKPGLEKTICGDAKISALDDALAESYNEAMETLSEEGKQLVRESQRRWLHFVKDVCFHYGNDRDDSTCVRQMYEKRVKDMKTAAVRIGPFLFSRVDYFYSGDDKENKRPYQGQTSYPRIDNPQSDPEKIWNNLMARSKAEGDEWCDGRPGDVDMDFEIISASRTIISTKLSSWFYCHGAPHGYGGSQQKPYVLTPTPHILEASDIFSDDTQWEDFLAKKSFDAAVEKYQGGDFDIARVKNIITNPKSWSLTKEGLTITIGLGMMLPQVFGESAVTISWHDLKPFLKPEAPIPQ